MIWLYRILFLPALLLALPYYLRRMLKRGGYRHDFHHRFGLIDRPAPKVPGTRRIWIQAVSVGEVQALAPLLQRLAARSNTEVILTTTTSTGYKLVRENYGRLVLKTGIFPLDFWPFSRNAWRRLEPDLAILMEGELWPEHLHQARARGVPVVLINARLSDRSFRRYRAVGPLSRWVFRGIRLILAGSTRDRDNFLALGLAPASLQSTGNLKFDVSVGTKLTPAERAALREELGLTATAGAPAPLILLGSSTWPGEETFLLGVLEAALAAGIDCRLLIVPRHAERRKEITALLERQPRPWHLRSTGARPPKPVEIYVADTTGELRRLSQVADLAFIGKSLPPNDGGQTPIEAAALGLPIVYGPAMTNFRHVCASLEAADAACRAPTEAEAAAILLDLLRDAPRRNRLATAAQAWHAANQGAADRTVAALEPFLK